MICKIAFEYAHHTHTHIFVVLEIDLHLLGNALKMSYISLHQDPYLIHIPGASLE